MTIERGPANFFKERDPQQIKLILLRGMEKLPDGVSEIIGRSFGAVSFNSNWFDKDEDLKTKLHRLDQVVDEAKNNGKQVIFICVSAGAALAEAYMLQNSENADKVRHLYSLSGVLDPRGQSFTRLRGSSSSFDEIIKYLEANLTRAAIKKLRLQEKVSVYCSKKEKDKTVPFDTAQPVWTKKENQRFVGPGHVAAIAQTLIWDIRQQLYQISKASFD